MSKIWRNGTNDLDYQPGQGGISTCLSILIQSQHSDTPVQAGHMYVYLGVWLWRENSKDFEHRPS